MEEKEARHWDLNIPTTNSPSLKEHWSPVASGRSPWLKVATLRWGAPWPSNCVAGDKVRRCLSTGQNPQLVPKLLLKGGSLWPPGEPDGERAPSPGNNHPHTPSQSMLSSLCVPAYAQLSGKLIITKGTCQFPSLECSEKGLTSRIFKVKKDQLKSMCSHLIRGFL